MRRRQRARVDLDDAGPGVRQLVDGKTEGWIAASGADGQPLTGRRSAALLLLPFNSVLGRLIGP